MKEVGIDRIKNVLKEIPFFEEFEEDELNYFAKQLSLRSVETNTVLFRQDDIGDYMIFIVEGSVDVQLDSPTSKRIIANYGYGSCVGEMSIVDDYPRSATIMVTEPSELLILTKNRFETINEDNPRVGIKIIKGIARNLSRRLRGSTGRFADLA